MAKRKCRADGCAVMLRSVYVFCEDHWRRLPEQMRQQIREAGGWDTRQCKRFKDLVTGARRYLRIRDRWRGEGVDRIREVHEDESLSRPLKPLPKSPEEIEREDQERFASYKARVCRDPATIW